MIGQNVIEIQEKCARFHILCSYTLCEEQANVFDSKINEENLVNCIQTLRELYQVVDLNGDRRSIKSSSDDPKANNVRPVGSDESNERQTNDCESKSNQSIKSTNVCSSNQSEFLCYYVLQNLDKENLIQEISRIDEQIRKSNDLQFAIKVFIAYKTYDYYAFMRLLLKSTLLQACILNRYLNRVRLNSFILLRKAITVGQQKVLVDQDYFIKQLFFKENELKKFCKQIDCDLTGDQIVFTKSKELNLDATFKPSRNALIDGKLGKLRLSEIINRTDDRTSVTELLELFKKVDFFNSP